jgi:hypothetical protein
MNLMQIGMLFEIVGFILATVFAAIILERQVVGKFATRFGQVFSNSKDGLTRRFPHPPANSVSKVMVYAVQALLIIGTLVFAAIKDKSFQAFFAITFQLAMIVFCIVPSFIRFSLWKRVNQDKVKKEGNIDWFLGFLFKDVVIIILSLPMLILHGIIVSLRFSFNWLARPDDLKKLFVVGGTILVLAGLIVELVATFNTP